MDLSSFSQGSVGPNRGLEHQRDDILPLFLLQFSAPISPSRPRRQFSLGLSGRLKQLIEFSRPEVYPTSTHYHTVKRTSTIQMQLNAESTPQSGRGVIHGPWGQSRSVEAGLQCVLVKWP